MASFVLAEFLAFGATLLMARVVSRRAGAGNLLLIPDAPREVVFEATVPATDADAAGIARSVRAALESCGTGELAAMRCAMGVEEMVAHAAASKRNAKRVAVFDVIVADFPERVQISLRDDGAPFDPTLVKGEGSEAAVGGAKDAEGDEGDREATADEALDSIAVCKAVSSRMQYSYTIGMNHTVIEVEK